MNQKERNQREIERNRLILWIMGVLMSFMILGLIWYAVAFSELQAKQSTQVLPNQVFMCYPHTGD